MTNTQVYIRPEVSSICDWVNIIIGNRIDADHFIFDGVVLNLIRHCLFVLAQQPTVAQGLFIHEVSRSHITTHQSVVLLLTSDQLAAEPSTWQHPTYKTDIQALVGFEPTISARERPQTHALDRAATGAGI
jgi:hypothetical protein